jgi:hypothetical protein
MYIKLAAGHTDCQYTFTVEGSLVASFLVFKTSRTLLFFLRLEK